MIDKTGGVKISALCSHKIDKKWLGVELPCHRFDGHGGDHVFYRVSEGKNGITLHMPPDRGWDGDDDV